MLQTPVYFSRAEINQLHGLYFILPAATRHHFSCQLDAFPPPGNGTLTLLKAAKLGVANKQSYMDY